RRVGGRERRTAAGRASHRHPPASLSTLLRQEAHPESRHRHRYEGQIDVPLYQATIARSYSRESQLEPASRVLRFVDRLVSSLRPSQITSRLSCCNSRAVVVIVNHSARAMATDTLLLTWNYSP